MDVPSRGASPAKSQKSSMIVYVYVRVYSARMGLLSRPVHEIACRACGCRVCSGYVRGESLGDIYISVRRMQADV